MSLALAPPLSVADAEPVARLHGVTKVYGHGRGAVTAVRDVSLEIGKGELVCILGSSGCGKSTLLALLAGLDRLSAGRIESQVARPALMFQDAGLLPWLSVARNVDLPLRLRRVPRAERVDEVERLLRLVHLDAVADRRPHQLSGGMRQRVALARALAQHSEVLLMDEPFAAVDAITRDLLHEDLARIAAERAMSVVFVTHNVREAVRLGDRVLLLGSRPGRLAGEFEVDIPRPRRIEDPAVGALALRITARLREEMGRHARD